MNATCFFLGYNIQETIHLTVKHYQQFCNRVVYHDNFSTDLSREIAEELGAEVKLFGRAGVLDDQAYLDVKKNCWKLDRSDLVYVVDDDEIVLPPIAHVNSTIYHCQGYEMYSNHMPVNNWLDLKKGVINDQYSKMACFNPREIEDIGYVYGCHGHQTRPKGKLVWGERIPLLHYRSVGGVDRLIKRHRMYNEKERGEANKRWNLANHYSESEAHKRKVFEDGLANSEILPCLIGDLQ